MVWTHSRKMLTIYIALGLLIPGLATLLLFHYPVGVNGDMWCWLETDDLDQGPQVLYIAVLLLLLLCIVIYGLLRRNLTILKSEAYESSVFVRTVRHGFGIFFLVNYR
eukprot:UN11126